MQSSRIFSRLCPAVLLTFCVCGIAAAQQGAGEPSPVTEPGLRVTGDRLSGIVLPIEPITGDIRITALKAWAWTVDDTKRLILQGDVSVDVGGFTVDAKQASIWINRIPSADGLINQIAMYMDDIVNPSNRAGIGVAGERILITGSARGTVTLNVARMDDTRRPPQAFVKEAEARLRQHLRGIVEGTPRLTTLPQVDDPGSDDPDFVPVPGGSVPRPQREQDAPFNIDLPGAVEARPIPLVEREGTIRFSAGNVEVRSGETENIAICSGGLMVQYSGPESDRDWSMLTLTAERAVIFTDPGPLTDMAQRELSVENVRGIYLEGDVSAMADDGLYVVRAPRIYYDMQTGQAVMLKSVMRMYSRNDQLPVYARAEEMRQIAANQWSAQRVRVSTSAFAVPHIAIGAETMVITQRPRDGEEGSEETWIESDHNTIRLSDVPIMYLPRFEGNTDSRPLRSIAVTSGDSQGIGLETTWDFFGLIGRREPKGVEGSLSADYYSDRGPALGLEFNYDVAAGQGAVDLFGLIDDGGEDRTESGRRVEYDAGFRGVALWEHRMGLGGNWSFQGQSAYISDPTFISAWRGDDFDERREYENAAYLKWQKDNQAFTFLGKAALNDFISNSYLLASRPYQVEKLPELGYYTIGKTFWDGAVVYSGETRASRLRLELIERTPAEIGVPGDAFGIDRTDEIAAMFRSMGYSTQTVLRGDTRHEFTMPMSSGDLRVIPFVVARVTWYDEEFSDFSEDAKSTRLYGAAGVRLATQLQRIYDDMESSLFDIHRLRHVIEPSLTLWYGYSDVDQRDLPVYDQSVESLSDGWAARLGVLQRWQTQRGGPGSWRSVDVFRLRTDVVIDERDDADRESPTGQFFDYRPEYSQPGDHVFVEGVWSLSDSFAVIGQGTYDLEEALLARGSIGLEMIHSPVLQSFVEYRMIDASDNELLGVRLRYLITPLYTLDLRPQWDFRREEFRSLRIGLTREFPDFAIRVLFDRDEIRNETRVGARLEILNF